MNFATNQLGNSNITDFKKVYFFRENLPFSNSLLKINLIISKKKNTAIETANNHLEPSKKG